MKKWMYTLTALLVSMCVYTTAVYADGWTVYSDYVYQQKSLWCWAATAENAVKSESVSTTRTQASAVSYLKGASLPNVTGSLADSANAGAYISMYYLSYLYTYGYFTYAMMRSHFDNHHTLMTAGGYYVNGIRQGGHMVLSIGYGISDEGNQLLFYFDPGTGQGYKYCTYQAFRDGSYNGRQYDQTVYNNAGEE